MAHGLIFPTMTTGLRCGWCGRAMRPDEPPEETIDGPRYRWVCDCGSLYGSLINFNEAQCPLCTRREDAWQERARDGYYRRRNGRHNARPLAQSTMYTPQ